jgi:tRNA A-37 threonylcarbamoyl transferase component Bud32
LSLDLTTHSGNSRTSALSLSYGDFIAHFFLWQKAFFLIPIWAIPVVIAAGAVLRVFGNRAMETGYVVLLCSMILYFMQDLLKRRISMDDDRIFFGFRSVAINDLVSADLRYRKGKFVPSMLVLLDKSGGSLKLNLSGLSSVSVDALIRHVQTRNSTLKLAPILPAMVKCRRIKRAPFDTADRLELPYGSRKLIFESIDGVKSSASTWMRYGPLVAFLLSSSIWNSLASSMIAGSSLSQLNQIGLHRFLTRISECIGYATASFLNHLWDDVGHATTNPLVEVLIVASLVPLSFYLLRFIWRPTALVADTKALRFVLRFGQLCLPMSKVNWVDIEKMSLRASTGKGGLLCIENKNGRKFSVALSALGNDDRGLLLKRIEGSVPDCSLEHELAQTMQPDSEHSYTEIWLQSLSQAPERKTLEPLEPGQILGENRFQVLQSLGVGGQGTAYLCKQLLKSDCENVVLKETILPVFTDNALRRSAIEKFDQEARLLKSLHHPGIVRLDQYFIEDHRAYLMMEHVRGSNLRDLVTAGGALHQSTVCDLTLQMCEILSYLHANKVIHRDFTPDNLMLSPDGRLKLIDFNVAQQIQSGATGTIVGKHAYLPPEQFRGKATIQSDLYALGATMYFLLTGKDPEPISQSAPKSIAHALDDEVNEIVKRATALQANRRYQTAEEILVGLHSWKDRASEPILIEVQDLVGAVSVTAPTVSFSASQGQHSKQKAM